MHAVVLQVIKMLLAVVLLFAICWSPTLVDSVLVEIGLVSRWNHGYLRYVRQAFALMSYANSCVNPVVYAFMSRNFRAGFLKALGCGSVSSAAPRGAADAGDSPRMRRRHVTTPTTNQGRSSAPSPSSRYVFVEERNYVEEHRETD